ncbi:proliferation marker protein Ki-67 isoform X1 [Lagopus muta]|uniref:proliferation marker protein Ki-67 isoform X1 n=1 Tax=Lagopus muta TaxID=64668 RepID=UPI00209ECF77|nr:proliferation marker protein Ki-67 isoform X1 [Lagopus muta]XP_048802099.1 proliferation marker protein Ki-67 isoform X1 [Lagopus muta]
MPLFGKIVIIKRNGTDGIYFPLTASSCLFGRRAECDIRIHLPQVSKEHCKIEVNENKEAILTNLSTVNPTQLNGGYFQQPVPLKHGDVLTIIDRSFRFEYPLQSTPKKRQSRSPKDEALQVLHVQQVAEAELLRKQTSGPKSLCSSDNAECKEQNTDENKQSTEENRSKAIPAKLQALNSCKIQEPAIKENEMSPFSKLYEKLKHEVKGRRLLQEGNLLQKTGEEDGKSVLLEPNAQISPSCVYELGSTTKGKRVDVKENTEECKINQDVINSELSQSSTVGNATRKSLTKTPQNSVSKEMTEDNGKGSHLQDRKELSASGKLRGPEVTPKPRKESSGNAARSLKPCLSYADKIDTSAVVLEKLTQAANVTNVSEGDKCVLSTPRPRRKSLRSGFMSPAKEVCGKESVSIGTPATRGDVLVKHESFLSISADTQGEVAVCRDDSLRQLPLAENKCLKQRRNSKQQTPGKSAKEETLTEICDQTIVNLKKRNSGSPAASKSPRRKSRQSNELTNKSVHSETSTSEEFTSELASASQKSGSGRKRGRPRTSGQLAEKALEANTVQEHHDETADRKDSEANQELANEGCQKKLDLADVRILRPHRLSSKRSSGSATVPKENETPSERNTSGLSTEEQPDKRKSQKRTSGDLLPQPLGKRKRVSFGGHLSPELFDKSLPPNSPIKKGAVPARLSLPFGNSPRAVLKKGQGLKHFAMQELSVHLQKEKMSPRSVSAQKSPPGSSSASGKATPTFTLSSPPYTKGRFSVSQITTPSPTAEEQNTGVKDMSTKEENAGQVQTPKSAHVKEDGKSFLMTTPNKLTRRSQHALKKTPMKRRSGAVAVLSAKRRSGASSANLLVAKTWAEVVKLGVARPQAKAVKKCVQKGRPARKITRSPKTPERKIKGHFSTGHAESPATIVVGRAYSTTVQTAGKVPKVVKNPILKQNMSMDENFTGLTEMFQTPDNKGGKTLALTTAHDFTPTFTTMEISDLQTPEESGEMMVSPLNGSDVSEQKQDIQDISYFLRGRESLKSVFDAVSTETPEKRKSMLKEDTGMDSVSVNPEKQASQMRSPNKRKTPNQKLESVEVVSSIKQPLKTPKQKLEPVESLSGIKQLMKTPKQKSEPTEVLSAIKQLLRTPKQKLEPAEVLSGIKQLMKTPKQKLEPVEALSGIKQLLKTPKQKSEPADVLSDIKKLLRTPKQKSEPAEVLSGIKQLLRTPKQKSEPAEALSGIKQLMKTPKQKLEPVESLSGIKQLMKTPEEKLKPAEVVLGPQQKSKPITDENASEKLLETPIQKKEVLTDVSRVNLIKKTPKLKSQPVEDMIGISRIFKTPKEKVKPIEDVFGISRLMKTPREKSHPVDDFVGLSRLMAEPRQKNTAFEVDYIGVKEIFDTPEKTKVKSVSVTDPKQEDTVHPSTNCSPEHEGKQNTSEGKDSQRRKSTSEDQSTQRPTRGRLRKTVHLASVKQTEKDLNLQELQGLEKKSFQEEAGEVRTSTSVAKSLGRGRRTNACVVEENISKHNDEKKVEAVSTLGMRVATQRPRRGKRKEAEELKLLDESLESCGKDSSVLQKEPATVKLALQDFIISDVSIKDDVQTMKAESSSRNSQNENCQLQTDFKSSENTPHEASPGDSEEMLLLPRKRAREVRKVENAEEPIAPKRGRRAKNDQVKQASSEELHATARRLRKQPSAKVIQEDERAFETAPAELSENRATVEMKITQKRVNSSRNARKHLTEVKSNICGMAPENTQNVQKIKDTLDETITETRSSTKNEREVSLGDEAENTQANATEASRRLKAQSPPGETNKMPTTVLVLESNSTVQETNRTRSRRGKMASSEQKTDESAKNVDSSELITPKLKSETEMEESAPKEPSGCVDEKKIGKIEDQNYTSVTTVTAVNSDSGAHSHQEQTENEQALKSKQSEILQENQTQNNGSMRRRGRIRKVNSELEQTSSKALGQKRNSAGDEEGMTCKQQETSENPSSQVRRSRRKQVNSIPQVTCSTFSKEQTLIEDHGKDETSVKDHDPALETTPSSTEDNPPRRGRRRKVAVASQVTSFLSVRKKRGLQEGDDKKTTVKEDQNPALGNETLQAETNASARDKRKKMDLAAEAKSSSSLQGKCGLSQNGDKEANTNGEKNKPLESVSLTKVNPLGRGRRKEALVSHTTNSISLRGKPASSVREEAPKEDNVPLETVASSLKENQLRRGRRNQVTFLSEATSSARETHSLSKESGRKNNHREAKNLISEKSASQEKMDLSKGNTRTKNSTSQPVNSRSLQGLPEDGKNESPEKQQSMLLEITPPSEENPSRLGRKKTVSFKSEYTSSSFLREKRTFCSNGRQKGNLNEGEVTSVENNSSQENRRQLRNKREKVEFKSKAAPSTSLHDKGNLPENDNSSGTQNKCLASTGFEKNKQPRKEVSPAPQPPSTSRRRKCQLPAPNVLAPKKLKSDNDENRSPKRGRRNKAKEELDGTGVKATRNPGGTDRRTRSSTRTSARTRK